MTYVKVNHKQPCLGLTCEWFIFLSLELVSPRQVFPFLRVGYVSFSVIDTG